MKYIHWKDFYSNHIHLESFLTKIKETKTSLYLKGLSGSSTSCFAASCIKNIPRPQLFILMDKEEAAYFHNDLTNAFEEEKILFFPSSYKRSAEFKTTDNANILLRTDVLDEIGSGSNIAVVTYPEALSEKVITKQNLTDNTLQLSVGEEVSVEVITEFLMEYKFQRVDFVYEPGQYSVRGSIVDIFSFANEYPYRIDFFGDDIDSIRTFNTTNQLSIEKLQKINIVPDIQQDIYGENRISFFEFLPQNTIIWCKDVDFMVERITTVYDNTVSQNTENESGMSPFEYLTTGNHIMEKISDFSTVIFGQTKPSFVNTLLEFNTSLQPDFNKNFDLLSENLNDKTERGYSNYILSTNKKQIERLKAIFESDETSYNVDFEPILSTLHKGFIDHDLRICCYTDHQIFKRYHRFKLKSQSVSTGRETLTLKEINELQPGDFIVHVDHGIGRFAGLEKIENNGKVQEALKLVYRDNDVLYASIHSLHRISKYRGKDSTPPKIHKLGSGAWQRMKQKTKKKVKDIAKELIELYAKRKAEKGFRFAQDSYLQHALESSFIYEDTPDQYKSTKAVKRDMESATPMDRLICGDVGFGKTEVAIRAAFKAVADSKQVAVLVPTTILALQHYKTFTERLADFPCNVEYISRLKTRKQQREIVENIENGKIDILIGTHRIVGKDISFKNLGLLIIDEEQKFGVTVKEKLKRLKVNVDTLTLTATPIPRTMQFSLMGVRDLSIIKTPPPNRYPILTELHTFNEDIIREAIEYEVSRNGQVFFIHNRVQNIGEVKDMVLRICPKVSVKVAHGQMKGTELEKIMLEFIRGDFDVLVATTIIESGLDIPNTNTIIINHAHHFGLSDLHQLRGRVGRSNKKAFCYLIAPPLSTLTPEARRRLKAVEDFSELGSGFNIALQDLDIRGAGDLLGGEQSGFIADIGFETYHRILDEALLELREKEFDDRHKATVGNEEPADNEPKEKIKYISDCQVDTDFEVLFPESYIENIAERIRLYRELDNIENEKQLCKFEERLIDRFGNIPEQSKELFDVVRMRWIAVELGIEKIILKKKKMILYFVSNQSSSYYASPIFSNILLFVQTAKQKCNIKQGKKLSLWFSDIKNITQAKEKLNTMYKKVVG